MEDEATPDSASSKDTTAGHGLRRLSPKNTCVSESGFMMLECTIKDDRVYRGVFALRMFPIRHPNEFIALYYTDSEDKEREIGVIDDLRDFPDPDRTLVYRSLSAHYHEQAISRIFRIRSDFGLLFLDVETQRGREGIAMPWRGECALDYGEHGKVLLDTSDNRYIIRDLQKLPEPDQRRFTKFIYW
jgi:hypothetical protein